MNVSSSHLATLGTSDRRKILADLVERARHDNGKSLVRLRRRVAAFERSHRMASGDLLKRLASGEQKETPEIAKWLFLLDVLEEHGG